MILNSEDIDVIETPSDYYRFLLEGIRGSRERIVLSALYLGSGSQELKLVEELRLAMKQCKDLRVTILVDFSRTSRRKGGSIQLLASLMSGLSSQVRVAMYMMPQINGILKYLPTPVDEMMGVYHCKYCIFDNDAILTGANLSADYFTNRQDRYYRFKSNQISNYLKEFNDLTVEYSYNLDELKSIKSPLLSDCRRFKQEIENLNSRYCSVDLVKFMDSNNINDANSVVAYPIIQHNSINVTQESSCLNHLIHQRWREILLSSPYCSYTKSFVDELCSVSKRGIKISMITTSENCHGFKGGKGFTGLVPELHKISISELIKSFENNETTKVLEYDRSNWTFHSKGAWFIPVDQSTTSSIVYVGSSNGGIRSTHRDFELGLMLKTRSASLINRMNVEIDSIHKFSKQINPDSKSLVKNIRYYQLKRSLFKFLASFL